MTALPPADTDREWSSNPRLGLIGRDRVLADKTAKKVHRTLAKLWAHTDLQEDRRGSHFDVQLADHVEGETRTYRVTVELMSIEPERI